MGRVELALRREGDFERLYAIKRLHAVYREEPELMTMFLDEARLAGLVRHAHVVPVLDVGDDEDGPFLVMDWVDGLSLDTILAHHRARDELIPVQLCLRLASQVANGLHAAHELTDRDGDRLELVHRDVSPGNVLVGFDGVARVTDFGVAKALGRTTRTSTGVMKGKLSYMSPEQLRFESIDHRSDLFALGIVLFQLLAGEHPYGTETTERARRVLAAEPPPDVGETREDVPDAVVELMYELLAPDPALRPSSALGVARRLDDVVADLVAEEGAVDLGEYMTRVFAAHRTKWRERVEPALRAATESIDAEPTVSEAERTASPARRWGVVAAAVLLAGLGGAVGWALLSSDGGADAVEAAEGAPSARAVEETAGTDAPAASAGAGDVAGMGGGADAEDVPAETAPTDPRTAEQPSRIGSPRRPARRRPAAMDTGMEGPPLWQWE